MAGFENDVLLCSNVNFNPALPKPHTGLITTDGQMIIGTTALNAGGTHLSIGVLTSPLGTISIGYSFPNITLDLAGSENFTWKTITTSQALTVDTGYICISPGGALSLSLPAVSAVGNIIEITLDGSTSFSITQGAGQQIRVGNLATMAGVGGSLTSTQQGDSIRMVCSVTNLKWNVLSSMGNPIIV